MRFTAENARSYAAKGVQVRQERKFQRQLLAQQTKDNPDPAPVPAQAQTELVNDAFSADLACACNETLDKLRRATKPVERAQLSRALRDLRETWHLATGKPRPGLTRPDQTRQPRREMPRVYPGVYKPNEADTKATGTGG